MFFWLAEYGKQIFIQPKVKKGFPHEGLSSNPVFYKFFRYFFIFILLFIS